MMRPPAAGLEAETTPTREAATHQSRLGGFATSALGVAAKCRWVFNLQVIPTCSPIGKGGYQDTAGGLIGHGARMIKTNE